MPINPIRQPLAPTVDHPAIKEPVRDPFEKSKAAEIDVAKVLDDEKLALLVAGVNYPRKVQGNADPQPHQTYWKLCMSYKDFLLANGLVDRVVIFDFTVGETRSFTKGGPKDGQRNVLFGPLRIKNYRFVDGDTLKVKRVADVKRYYFSAVDDLANDQSGDPDADVKFKDYQSYQGGKEKSLSISDVYGIFRAAFAAQLKEVHFFCHAHHDGPILVNTDFYTSKYYDKDGRTRDFTNPKLGHVFDAQNLPHSRASFVNQPIVCVWGCENDTKARALIVAAWAKQAKQEPITTELEEIKKRVAENYAAVFAKTMGFAVIGALPGTYAVHEGEPNDDPSTFSFNPTVMHVNLTTCGQILDFYKKNLGIAFATTGAFKGHPTYGRGYAIFNP